MRSTGSRWTWAIPLLCAAAVAGGVVLTLQVPGADLAYLSLDVVVGLTYPLIGALIVTRLPKHPVGWLFCVGGAGMALQALAGGYAAYGEPRGWPGTDFSAWTINWVFFTGFGPLLLLPLLLPDGRLPSPRWRPVIIVLAGGMAVLELLLMFRDRVWVWGRERPNPIGFVPTELAAVVFAAVIVVLGVAGVAALAVRLKKADPDGDQRRRLIPVFGAAAAIAAALVADSSMPPESPVGVWLMGVALPLLPAATAISIFRYRLFEIEVLIRRTVVYALVTAVLLAVYVGVVATAHELFRLGEGALEPVLGTAVVAIAFAPVRDLAQRAVGRLLFGNRSDPAAALSRLGQRLEASADPTRLLDGAADTIARTLRLPAVAVLAADGAPLSVVGAVPVDGVRLPLMAGGRREGELLAAPRSPGEALSRADLAVLDDLARHLAVAVAAVRLTREVQASREGLVIAREEERWRLRRDLHDGLGPGLAAIGVRLDLIEAKAPEALREPLADVRELTQGLMGHVRRIVHDLRPPALDELGLAGALEDLALDAEGSPEIAVSSPDRLPELPAAVEVAAYRIAQEALANALRHAEASRIEILVQAGPRRLVLQVRDDGRGLPEPLVEGVGSGSMRERAAELGGTLERRSPRGDGTVVTAVLPL
ncbi:sensor histidine kinase [Acrocarpospora catenulata]|uniref:sensor histidine kinase n=1 Tax=Acrocarpospora catenulata TaxID=2836182 RepID=UPI001BDAC263|nr:histidine kinase [Acrocarpospora catenulata]